MASPSERSLSWRNWAGNQTAAATTMLRPANTDELLSAIDVWSRSGRQVRPVGSGHSFTALANAEDVRLDLSRMAGVISIDRAAAGGEVTVWAGTSLRALNEALSAHGLALPNLGDIDSQTISGAISTGTHGTGGRFGCLSTFVTALALVTAAGRVVQCSPDRHPEIFAAARVGLGVLGVITEVTLRCTDAFVLRAYERPARLAEIFADLPALIGQNDHFEFYWFPYTDRAQVKCNNRVPADDRPLSRWRGWLDDEFLANTVFAGACRIGRAVPGAAPAISGVCARALAARVYTGRSDRVFCTKRRVRFVEMEYALPRAALAEAFQALRQIVDHLPFRVLFPVEVRFAAPDDIWLSHGYGRETAYLAVHQYAGAPYEPYFRAFEAVCAGLGGRPHWGKLHYRDAESLRPVYPRFDDFLAVRDELDPGRLFGNAYTARLLGR